MFHTAGADPSRLMDKTDRECKIELQSEPKSKPSAPRLSLQIKAQRSGLELAAKNALKASGKFIPWNVVTIASDGRIVD